MPASRPDSQAQRAEAFGAALRRLRRQKGLTQREVAARVPMSAGNLSRLETGGQGPPADETIERLAAALDVDATELLTIAGRSISGAAFERAVLEELRALREELRAGFARVERALAVRTGENS